MTDIFLSYKREDVERVRPLIKVLEARGWTLFWDPDIVSGEKWEAVLDRQLKAARCVVVLWSSRSVASEWVRREARSGASRGVLLPVLIEKTMPPDEFRAVQATDLSAWHGDPDGPAVATLLGAIDALIGRTLSPVDLYLVTGERGRWPDLGPTVNMGCRLDNVGRLDLLLNRLDIAVFRDGEPAFDLVWHLFYSTDGLEHLKDPSEGRIVVAGRTTWQRGVQFQCTAADVPNAWPVGDYELEMLGWVNSRPAESRANVRTRFRTRVGHGTYLDLVRWRRASVEEYERSRTTNLAVGFPVPITDIRTGLGRCP
jgi:hypothetical protein